ncbi:laccase-like [Photinus pyralis]|uniref:laccase-like n=1 Tax=Photinus pyralis TaxID=7054 RepID=UPI00126721DC|nr:laccase-like [Photinus pyralis]XP_031351626.1 laccase-like [Photinus pyralis]
MEYTWILCVILGCILETKANFTEGTACARVCVDGETKTCYYQFYVEQYSTMGWSCDHNSSQCIRADGVERSVYTVNRMLPGPLIEVCKGDTVVVDVHNAIEGQEVTIHWHGVWQTGTQFSDGVPFVTQCPILSGNTFRYKWRADNPGTHFWHSHSGFQKMDGVAGGLIIRQAAPNDDHSDCYKHDLSEHVIILNDWFHYLTAETFPGALWRPTLIGQVPHSLLINGKGQAKHPDTGVMTETPLEQFHVVPGETYRFRLINALASFCPVTLTIDRHKLTVISSDGEPFDSVVVDGIQSWAAERFDFIFTANQPQASYWLRIKTSDGCLSDNVQQLALVHYSEPSLPKEPRPSPDSPFPDELIVLNQYTSNCSGDNNNSICFTHLKAKRKADSSVLKPNADVKLFLPLGTYEVSGEELFESNSYNGFLVFSDKLLTQKVDTINYMPPPSPLLSQYRDVNASHFCNRDNKPDHCEDYLCSCTHKIDLPLNQVIELIIIDESTSPKHTHNIHLHGYAFNVIGIGILPNGNASSIEKAQELDKKGLLQRQFDRPVFKDTLTIPIGGYIVIRFKSNNPGYWFFHCHFAHHITTGMNLIFKVGTCKDMPPVPHNFPKCGNYLPSF